MRVAIVLLAALSGCGYGFSQRYEAVSGARQIHVRPFENRSTEPDLGAMVTTALRRELSLRGADGGEGASAVLDGEVRALDPVLTSERGATWRIAVEVKGHLVPAPNVAAVDRTVRREADFLGGADPLETEGRRALALRRAVDDAARDLLRALEQ